MASEVRFYNGGDKVMERMSYISADYNIREENGVRYHVMVAPKKGFFTIPHEVTSGNGSQIVQLPREALEKHGERGFVMIDKNLTDEQCAGEPFMANSDEMAKLKGDLLWREYQFKMVKEYEDNNEQRKTARLHILRPSPTVVHAYKELGMTPPQVQDPMATLPPVQPLAPAVDIAALRAQLKKEILEELTAPPSATPATPEKPRKNA
jgi:hypothetical protein